jgi:hypothetical protein
MRLKKSEFPLTPTPESAIIRTMFTNNIHNVESIEVDGIRRTDGSRGWITLKVKSVSEYTGPAGECEITFFCNDIESLRLSFVNQLDNQLITYA